MSKLKLFVQMAVMFVMGGTAFVMTPDPKVIPEVCFVHAGFYDRIKTGMSLDEVRAILPCKGAIFQVDETGYSLKAMRDRVTGIVVHFNNEDRVFMKTKINLPRE